MGSVPEIFTLGHSPDPDDAFMFYAMAENKIDLRGYHFEHRLEDIQTLNERALHGELHISAISIHAYAFVADKYALLPCGASMGDGYGPIVIRKKQAPEKDLDELRDELAQIRMKPMDVLRPQALRQFSLGPGQLRVEISFLQVLVQLALSWHRGNRTVSHRT